MKSPVKNFLCCLAGLISLSVFTGCLPLTPQYEFSGDNTRVHSFEPGSPEEDRAAVNCILAANRLEYLPIDSVAVMGEDDRIHELHLSNRGLITIPQCISELKELEDPQLGMNNLSTIPACISELGRLEHLGLQKNNLHSLPESITGLSIVFWTQGYHGGGYYTAGVNIDSNFLCNVPDTIQNWLDSNTTAWRDRQSCVTP